MVNKAPKPLAEFPQRTRECFSSLSHSDLVTLNANHYPAPTPALFILRLFEEDGAGAETNVDPGPSLTSELSTEGRESVSGRVMT